MKLPNFRRAFGRTHLNHLPARYPELTAECSDELALIADRRRSELARF
jgi:hypothetical protein